MEIDSPILQGSQALIGRVLSGRYRILQKVGEGGMGWIFHALDEKLQIPVAVKVLLPSLAEKSDLCNRFLHEAKIQGQLKHPHVVGLLDSLEAGGCVAIVLEWMPGENFSELLERIPPPLQITDIWLLMAPILDALTYAHEHQIIHRDLKPENFMIKWQDGTPVIKLTDFGIAKVLGDYGEALTKTGAMMGTIKFMSPEQLRDTKRVDHRSDIYSLGVCLYYLATGGFPYVGNPHQMMFNVLLLKPALPPQDYFQDIDPALAALILEAIAPEPEQRIQTCRQLQESLYALLPPNQRELPLDQNISLKGPLPENSLLFPPPPKAQLTHARGTPETASYAPISFEDEEGFALEGAFASTSPMLLERVRAEADVVTLDALAATDLRASGSSQSKADKPLLQSGPLPTGEETPGMLTSANGSPPDDAPASGLGQGRGRLGLFIGAALGLCVLCVGLFWFLQTNQRHTTLSPSPAKKPAAVVDCAAGAARSCYAGPAHAAGKGICKRGRQGCKDGRWGPCVGSVLPLSKERCNGLDDNCDGRIDESWPEKDKPCQRIVGKCIDHGSYQCAQDQMALRCVLKDNIPSSELRVYMTISPKEQPFTLRVSGRKQERFQVKIQDRFCFPTQKNRRRELHLEGGGYNRCKYSFSPHGKTILQIKMQRKGSGTFEPPMKYCVKKKMHK